jgi:hypothetical protein
MLNEGYRYGNVYFIDESFNPESQFAQKFAQKFNKQPNVVETIAYDSLKILSDLIEANPSGESRQDLDLALIKKEVLRSENASWKLQDDVWLKDLSTFRIRREGIESAIN